jgi:hypothetical protein
VPWSVSLSSSRADELPSNQSGLRRGEYRLLFGVDQARRDEEVRGAVAHDSPPVVVKQQMVMSAKKDAVGHISAAAVLPMVDVMSFRPGRWSAAAGESAAAVSCGECCLLSGCEAALGVAEVDDLAGGVELDRQCASVTDVPLDCPDAHRGGLTFDCSVSSTAGKVPVGDQHSDSGPLRANDIGRADRAEADELDEMRRR